MGKKNLMHIVRQEKLSQELERFCSVPQTLPLIMFYDTFVTEHYYPRETVSAVASKVLGEGSVKTITYQQTNYSDMMQKIAFLKALPQKLFMLTCKTRISDYDDVALFAESLAKATGKHVIAMIDDKNKIVEDGFGSRKLTYWDNVVDTFVTWHERALVWFADRTGCYGETRQVYLACLKYSLLDMLKEWSEKDMKDEVARALEDSEYMNTQYLQYVCSKPDMPYVLKHGDFDERLLVEETVTEYGPVLTIKVENLESTGGIECRLVHTRWRRVNPELKITKPTSSATHLLVGE